MLRLGGQAGLLAAFGLLTAGCSRDQTDAVEAVGATGSAAVPGAPALQFAPTGSAYGPLRDPDPNGVRLPAGFWSRIVARSGDPIGPGGYVWHRWPDGASVFAQPDGGWVYVSNSEVPLGLGGVGMLRFAADASVIDAKSLLTGTSSNCSGGPTPWGTWLSCEEVEGGRVFEVDPLGVKPPAERPALGRFVHEGAAVDPTSSVVYLTEDQPDGRFYRCKLTTPGNLATGLLQVAEVGPGNVVIWHDVPDPLATTTTTRTQVPASTPFLGGEGIWYTATGPAWTTKHDNKVWHYDPATKVVSVLYDSATYPDPVLSGVDNLTAWPGGGLLVCEDGGDMQVVGLGPDGSLSPVLQIVGQATSELTGIGLSPAHDRLYVSSQRGTDGRGLIYEISGPWPLRRRARACPAEAFTRRSAVRARGPANVRACRCGPRRRRPAPSAATRR